ncbi:site-2 protease [Desulfitobacterium dichloroeliminans LMG P-21439]|uniref:Zinc metalloprotease n=1 Tax=Desulfitobacterium dichloroeliminans (strain LMG P-21439 / DCA1) TaxID=871963 RepID=L0FAH8_DESDL|nr:RIP metalloprotease RseP [Desulfitobacterium dichloroeliminans]AGA70005.1 site-2 protease [Desulfitobacterium dichloroeliminans LMG P-21439]
MLSALSVVFAFGLLVIIHELGHFIVARLNGIKVLEFAFGFGPKIIGFKGKETNYSLRLIPLGGFVKLYGMDAEFDENGNQNIAPSNDPRSFNNKKVWQRMSVIAAGPIMNLVLAIFLFIIVFAYFGIATANNTNVVGTLIEGMPAQAAGIQPGDKVVSVNGVDTTTWNDLTQAIHTMPEKDITLVIEHEGQQRALTLKTELDAASGRGLVGISPEVIYEKASLSEAAQYGFKQTVSFTRLILVTLAQMVTGETKAELGGPVAIVQAIDQSAESGWENYLGFIGILSIQLGLLNLFPIPALDGSHLVFLLIEGLRGKPMNPERQSFIHFLGFIFLMGLMLAVTYQDIVKLFSGKG